jgi:hypothetical protein
MSRGGRLHTLRTSEDVEQAHLFDWLRLTRWRGWPLADWYWAVPNGGSRHLLEAVKLKRMGTKPGVPDIFGAIPAGDYHGHFIEMKARDGRVRPEQRDLHEQLRSAGYRVDVCFGWDEARLAVERYVGRGGSVVQERA